MLAPRAFQSVATRIKKSPSNESRDVEESSLCAAAVWLIVWPRYALVALSALAIGFWIGWWGVGARVDLSDLVSLVSVIATALVAIYTVRSNRKGEQERLEHDERLLGRRLTEERARGQREEAVERLLELKKDLRSANPSRLDFSRYHHPNGADQGEIDLLIGWAASGWNAALESTSLPEWFSMLGWTGEIRDEGDSLATAVDVLEDAWLDLYHDYGRPPTPLEGLPNFAGYEAVIAPAWAQVQNCLGRLEQFVRDS